MTVHQNVTFGPRMRGRSRTEQNRVADEFLGLVGLRHTLGIVGLVYDRILRLIGMRVVVARALLAQPRQVEEAEHAEAVVDGDVQVQAVLTHPRAARAATELQAATGDVADRVPVQAVAGARGCQRPAPTGGAAYGMPGKRSTPSAEAPATRPLSMDTLGERGAAVAGTEAVRVSSNSRLARQASLPRTVDRTGSAERSERWGSHDEPGAAGVRCSRSIHRTRGRKGGRTRWDPTQLLPKTRRSRRAVRSSPSGAALSGVNEGGALSR